LQPSFSIDTSGFPSVIFSLRNLTELSLEYQAIKSVPDAIENLTYLTLLNLNCCIELETLSPNVGLLPLKELNLTGCVSLKTPPIEITRRGLQQTIAFLKRLISGSTACKRTKLMLVGLGGAGKTSLVRAFLESHSTEPPVVTDGIDIVKWKVPLPVSNEFLEFSVWDFAGQSVYYHTHQVKYLILFLLIILNSIYFSSFWRKKLFMFLHGIFDLVLNMQVSIFGFLLFVVMHPMHQFLLLVHILIKSLVLIYVKMISNDVILKSRVFSMSVLTPAIM
jgi:hypothetical protein